jgi:hypothetical protein
MKRDVRGLRYVCIAMLGAAMLLTATPKVFAFNQDLLGGSYGLATWTTREYRPIVQRLFVGRYQLNFNGTKNDNSSNRPLWGSGEFSVDGGGNVLSGLIFCRESGTEARSWVSRITGGHYTWNPEVDTGYITFDTDQPLCGQWSDSINIAFKTSARGDKVRLSGQGNCFPYCEGDNNALADYPIAGEAVRIGSPEIPSAQQVSQAPPIAQAQPAYQEAPQGSQPATQTHENYTLGPYP